MAINNHCILLGEILKRKNLLALNAIHFVVLTVHTDIVVDEVYFLTKGLSAGLTLPLFATMNTSLVNVKRTSTCKRFVAKRAWKVAVHNVHIKIVNVQGALVFVVLVANLAQHSVLHCNNMAVHFVLGQGCIGTVIFIAQITSHFGLRGWGHPIRNVSPLRAV